MAFLKPEPIPFSCEPRVLSKLETMPKCGNLVARRTNDVRTPRAGEASIFLSKFRCAACGRVGIIASEAGGSLRVRAG